MLREPGRVHERKRVDCAKKTKKKQTRVDQQPGFMKASRFTAHTRTHTSARAQCVLYPQVPSRCSVCFVCLFVCFHSPGVTSSPRTRATRRDSGHPAILVYDTDEGNRRVARLCPSGSRDRRLRVSGSTCVTSLHGTGAKRRKHWGRSSIRTL